MHSGITMVRNLQRGIGITTTGVQTVLLSTKEDGGMDLATHLTPMEYMHGAPQNLALGSTGTLGEDMNILSKLFQ